MKMVDMKRKKKKSKGNMKDTAASLNDEMYPYGLRVSLQRDEIKKLGIDLKNLDVGQKATLMATVEVSEIAEHKSSNMDEYSKRVELQITEMNVSFGKMKKKSTKFADYNANKDVMGGMAE